MSSEKTAFLDSKASNAAQPGNNTNTGGDVPQKKLPKISAQLVHYKIETDVRGRVAPPGWSLRGAPAISARN